MQSFAEVLRGFWHDEPPRALGDFTTTLRVIPISLIAVTIGALAAFVALALLRLIGLFTNLFFFGRWSSDLVSPAGNHLGVYELLVPVAGALVVALMARYGSRRIRGHGIPEAIESILVNGSKVEPRVAFLKPVSSAISIGSGGPFGAEGPIIMTGGAFGSLIAQLLQLTSAERKTLLAAGAAGGMAATFGSPVAAVLLAVELLLFEWKPRSVVPVALASATATLLRQFILGVGPLFPVAAHSAFLSAPAVLGCVVAGLLAGGLAVLLTAAVYAAEDGFHRLPIHWMWWPPIGGLVVGIGGLIFPQALGVGYDVIGALLRGDAARGTMVGILLVKSVSWAVSLASGTSGGVLAPLLMMGGALGGLESAFLPGGGPGFWQMVSMGATLGGTIRSPLTGVVFVLEVTHDVNMLLPLLVATVVAHGVTVLALRRSIMTEKVARRGQHLSCEYAVDPLEILDVREVMPARSTALPATLPVRDLGSAVDLDHNDRGQVLFPVVDSGGRLVGRLTRTDLRRLLTAGANDSRILGDVAKRASVVAYPDEPLRVVANRIAESGRTCLPVVERGDAQKVLGVVALKDLMKARARGLMEERHRERVLRIRLPGRPREVRRGGNGRSSPSAAHADVLESRGLKN
jgi:CIC family chloride channel protein